MRIRKVSQTTPIQAQVVDGYSTSQVDSYSANYVNNTFEYKGKIIWTNPNPTSAFSGQTINLNESLNNYDAYSIIFVQSTGGPRRYFNSGLIPVGYGTILGYLAGGVYFYRPTSEIVSGSTITFEDGEMVSAQTGTITADNTRVIPLYVIGYNTGLFE